MAKSEDEKPQPKRRLDELPDVLKLEEVAGFLGVCGRTLKRWVTIAEFPKPFQLGGRINYWRKCDLVGWLRERGAGPEVFDAASATTESAPPVPERVRPEPDATPWPLAPQPPTQVERNGTPPWRRIVGIA